MYVLHSDETIGNRDKEVVAMVLNGLLPGMVNGLMVDHEITISDLKEKVQRFIEEREWTKYHKPKDLAISISVESSELLERFQWLTDSEIESMLQDSQKLQETDRSILRNIGAKDCPCPAD